MQEIKDNKNNIGERLFQTLENSRKLGFGYCIGAGIWGLTAIALSAFFPNFVNLQTYLIPIIILGGLLGFGLHKLTEQLMDSLISPITNYLKLRIQLWRIDGYEKAGYISKSKAKQMRREAIEEYEALNPKQSAREIITEDKEQLTSFSEN